jgi:hypothetical protein
MKECSNTKKRCPHRGRYTGAGEITADGSIVYLCFANKPKCTTSHIHIKREKKNV